MNRITLEGFEIDMPWTFVELHQARVQQTPIEFMGKAYVVVCAEIFNRHRLYNVPYMRVTLDQRMDMVSLAKWVIDKTPPLTGSLEGLRAAVATAVGGAEYFDIVNHPTIAWAVLVTVDVDKLEAVQAAVNEYRMIGLHAEYKVRK